MESQRARNHRDAGKHREQPRETQTQRDTEKDQWRHTERDRESRNKERYGER